MTFKDIPTDPTPKALRQFAAAWLVFFLAFGVHQFLVRGHQTVGIVMAVAAVVIGPLGLVWPPAVRWIFVGWMVLAFPIGWVLSQVMLLLMFYGLLTPVAALFRLRGRDILHCKRSDRETYWLPKQTPTDVRSYFKQY